MVRVLKVICWTLVCFLLAPSRAQAVAYCLLGGFLLLSVGITLVILGFSWNGIKKIFRS